MLGEANFVADVIANLGHSSDSLLYWNDRVYNEASRAFHFDIVNSGCIKGFSL